VASIVVLHPGEMGAAIGHALVDIGQDVYWRPAGRGPDTARRADRAGLLERDTVLGVDLVVSICPPHAAVPTARSVDGFTGVYLDANAISPDTAAEVAAIVRAQGATYVDGGVIGGPPVTAGTTRLYLSGPAAPAVHAWFAGARIGRWN
jgi:3-hydroxyisobutyrate dehydrogenase-like beta-hydroxyacid dehydrogenase